MKSATVGDLKRILEHFSDDDVLVFRVFDDADPSDFVASSEVLDSETMKAYSKDGQDTGNGECSVCRVHLHLEFD